MWQCWNWCLTECTFEVSLRFEVKFFGSEVCDGYALGFCCRNVSSGRCSSYMRIVVVQKIGAQRNVHVSSVRSLERNFGNQMYEMVTR